MSAAVSSPRHTDDALLSNSASSLPVPLHDTIPAVSATGMPESEDSQTNVEPPGDMDDASASSRTGTPPAQPSSRSSHPSRSPSPARRSQRQPDLRPVPQEDTQMEGTAEPEDRPAQSNAPMPPPPAHPNPEHDEDAPSEDDDEPGEDGEGSESEDEDDDDYEQKIFLKTYTQDTTVPSPEELDEMNRRRGDEVSALDDDRWIAQAFTPLDDPAHEIIPGVARLSWTLENFHGSKDAPNKSRSQSSAPVILTNHDGKQYQFCIKVFPRGNDGTEYMSVYIECCPVDTSTDAANDDAEVFDRVGASWWEVTAQFGCVMYNPVEPRVHKFQKSHHQFTSINADFGWPRFAGPWSRIHLREHLQYRPLLQDDKVAFTAFVRLVKDPTRALWYHNQYPHNPDWDSVLKTGYRGLTTATLSPIQTPLISALIVWYELAPFRELISAFERNNGLLRPLDSYQPLLDSLKACLQRKQSSRKQEPATHDASLDQVITALEWYGCYPLPSVFEAWKTLKRLIKLEIDLGLERSRGPMNKPQKISDLAEVFFDHVALIESHAAPLLPTFQESDGETTMAEPDSQPQHKSLKSTQLLADEAMDSPWDEDRQIISLELPRQAYDTQKRKWTKLVHNIKLEDTIVVGKYTYSLFAFICHTGELGSGRFHPVMRPRGPNTPWLRWSTRGSSRGSVLPQTHRQAVIAHEGSDSAETSAAVACVALYLRQDGLNELLVQGPERELHDVFNPRPEDTDQAKSVNTASDITVAVHMSTRFAQHTDKAGIVDTWKAEDDEVLLLSIRSEETLYDLHEKLRTNPRLREVQFLLWPLDMQHDIRQYCPPLVDAHLETPIALLRDEMNGTHFWLHVLEGKQAEVSKQQYEEIARRKAAESLASLKQSIPSPVAVVEQPPPPPPSGSQNSLEGDIVMGGTDDESTETQAPNGLPQPPAEVLALLTTPASQDTYAANLENMPAGTTRDEVLGNPRSPDGPLVQLEESIPLPPPTMTMTLQEPQKHLYVFVKHFYPLKQIATPEGPKEYKREPLVEASASHLVPLDAVIKEVVVRPNNDAIKGKGVRFYRERPGKLPIVIDGESTFAAAGLSHGSIIITEPILTDMHIKTYSSQGFPLSLAEMFSPANIPGQNNFGTGWSYCPVKFGRLHGQGSVVYANGDAYIGQFTSGKRHTISHGDPERDQGTMMYANGSNYQGQWKDDQPNGHGTMIYFPSGNKYTGPFKDGKQTGRGGITYWQDASVNEKICRICYVDERNTVLVRCGHMVACQTCATQLSECPVCRRQIDQVIRVWDTLQ